MSSEDIDNSPIIYQKKGTICYIIINTKMNTVNLETAQMIIDSIDKADKDDSIRVIILKSMGDRIFSAGFDLNMFLSGFSDQLKKDLLRIGGGVSRKMFFCKKPIIAEIQGSAIGLGCIMACSADFRFVAKKEGAYFTLPEIDIPLFPATGPTLSIINIVGNNRAKEMLLTGRKVPYEEFDKWGGITQLCDPDKLSKEVFRFARGIAKKKPVELIYEIKSAMNMLAMKDAKERYEFEDEFAEYFLNGLIGREKEDLDIFIEKMWNKFGSGRISI